MIKNNVLKFIDSCVGSIARKIQDEFDESKHPRDKGGKFTSKGGEGRGGGDVESSKKFSKRINTAVDKFESMFKSDPKQAKEHLYALGVDADEADSFKEIEADVISAVTKNLNRAEAKLRIDGDEDNDGRKNKPVKASESLTDNISDNLRQISENADSKKEFLENAKSYLEDYLLGDLADGDYAEENFEMSSEDVEAYVKDYIESGKLDKLADDYYEEDDDDTSVTGPEDRDYMNEEDDDADVSLEQYKKNVSENFDGDEEYEVEARYDRAKYHSDKFKKLKNGEYEGTPEAKRLRNYYRRIGMKKPEDAFKIWWDI